MCGSRFENIIKMDLNEILQDGVGRISMFQDKGQ